MVLLSSYIFAVEIQWLVSGFQASKSRRLVFGQEHR
jgi:hypothetical protein